MLERFVGWLLLCLSFGPFVATIIIVVALQWRAWICRLLRRSA
jgi:hypothetical protein